MTPARRFSTILCHCPRRQRCASSSSSGPALWFGLRKPAAQIVHKSDQVRQKSWLPIFVQNTEAFYSRICFDWELSLICHGHFSFYCHLSAGYSSSKWLVGIFDTDVFDTFWLHLLLLFVVFERHFATCVTQISLNKIQFLINITQIFFRKRDTCLGKVAASQLCQIW